MNSKKEGEFLKNIRILGCCNLCFEKGPLRPHEVGGYANQILSKLGFYCEVSPGGINSSIVSFAPSSSDVIFIDDVIMNIGQFKIKRLRDCLKRGHNALKKSHYLKTNPWIFLIGAGPVENSLDSYVNKKLGFSKSYDLKISICCFIRGFIKAWPNISLTLQIAKSTYRAYKERNGDIL